MNEHPLNASFKDFQNTKHSLNGCTESSINIVAYEYLAVQ